MKPAPEISSTQPGARRGRPWRAGGFTLIELLVVVALIGILSGIVGFSISGGGSGQALGSAQRNLLAMIQSALANAQLNKTRSRLIIYADKNVVPSGNASASQINPKVLRYYGVIYAASDDPALNVGDMGKGVLRLEKPFHMWFAANSGSYLPDGIYFVPSHPSAFALNLPGFATSNNALTDSYGDYTTSQTTYNIHSGQTTGLMQIEFPLAQAPQGLGDWYYFIEFAPDGFYYNTNGNNNIILGTAENPTDNSADFRGNNQNNLMFTGVQLRALGGAAPFRTYLDIVPSGGGS